MKNTLQIIKFKALYFFIQIKMALIGCLSSVERNFKLFILFFLGIFFISLNIAWAQEAKWPWVFEGENLKITNSSEDHFSPSIASGISFKSFYLAVWYRKTLTGFDIYGTRVTSKGELVDEEEIPICAAANDQIFPSVVWGKENFLVVWQDKRSGKRWDIYGTRVTLDGHILDPNGIPIAVGKGTNDQISPAVSFDGENFFVTWQGKRSPNVWNIYFNMVSGDGKVLNEKPVSINTSSKNQVSPSVSFDGTNYFVVWQDDRDGKVWEIFGARVNPLGNILDPQGIRITSNNDLGGNKWRPVISWGRDYYFIVWTFSSKSDQWYLYGKRVSPEGEVLDLIELALQRDRTNKASPTLLWDGTEYLLVWEEEPEGESKIFGVSMIYDDSLMISEANQISALNGIESSLPSIGRIGNDVLILWEAKEPDGFWQIYGQRLNKLSH